MVDGAKYEVQTADDGTDFTASGSTIGLSASTDINTAATHPTGANRTNGDQFTVAGNATLTVALWQSKKGSYGTQQVKVCFKARSLTRI